MNTKARILIAAVATVVLAGAATTYTVMARNRGAAQQETDAVPVQAAAGPGSGGSQFGLGTGGQLLFRNTAAGPAHGKVAAVPAADPGVARQVGELACDRFYAAGGKALCLMVRPAPLPTSYVVVLDANLRELRRVEVAGTPNRARLSPDGRMASWTTFVLGDSYAKTGTFSTRTGIMDTVGGRLLTNIEDIPLEINGQRHRADDVNYWGVTFARDNNRFYATVSTKGQTHLIEGDYADWSAKALRENVECPSLSPDETRVVFKKRIPSDQARPWRLHVLNLATLQENPVAEESTVDDQAAWLDQHTVGYALTGPDDSSDIWAAPADGSGKSRLLVKGGSSPTVPQP